MNEFKERAISDSGGDLRDVRDQAFVVMPMKNRGGKGFIIIFLIGLMGACFAFVYLNRDLLNLSSLTGKSPSLPQDSVACPIYFSAGAGKFFSLELIIPCGGKAQKAEIEEKLPRLKHEVLMAFHRPHLEESIRTRNLEDVRRELKAVIDRHLEEPVDDLYFGGFFHE